jgi:hypothetical protein
MYIKLTNSDGSTILPPTVVETLVFLEVGNHELSVRMKQLARTITNSSSTSGNLGLNHTVFGKVKQISLSSYLKHSLHTGGGSDAPSPAPMHHHAHHRHRHHHHHHDHDSNGFQAPAPPIHLPVPQTRHAPPPSGCPYGTDKPKKRGHITPAAEPTPSSQHSASAASPPHPWSRSPASHPPHDPSTRGGSPVPSPPARPRSPLPSVSFAHAHPPSEPRTGTTNSAPNSHAARAGPAEMSQVAPAPHSCESPLYLKRNINICCRTCIREVKYCSNENMFTCMYPTEGFKNFIFFLFWVTVSAREMTQCHTFYLNA